MTLGEYLREKRQQREWTLEKMAQRVGCTRQYLSAIERDEVTPSRDKLRQIAHHLGSDGLMLRLIAGDVPQEIIEALKRQPEVARFLIQNANHPNLDLSILSRNFYRSVN